MVSTSMSIVQFPVTTAQPGKRQPKSIIIYLLVPVNLATAHLQGNYRAADQDELKEGKTNNERMQ